MKIVEVEWTDSCGQNGWHNVKTHQDNRPAKCKTAGYLVSQSKEHVTICMSEDTNNNNLNDSICIPRHAVTKIRTVKQ